MLYCDNCLYKGVIRGMGDFGLMPEGFRLKRLADIRASLYARLSLITDPDTGESLNVDFDENDPLVQILDATIEANAEAWMQLENVVRFLDPDAATGVVQSASVQVNGITRREATVSTVELQLTGTPGTIIQLGQRVSDPVQIVTFVTTADITLDGSGAGTVTALSEITGAVPAQAGTLTNILTPINGWSSVVNLLDANPGALEESDSALRARRARTTEAPSQSTSEAIFSALSNIPGTEFVRLLVNDTLITDARGLPGKSIAAVLQGGNDQVIAETLFLRTATGVGYFGNTSMTITDRRGINNEIRWIRPSPVELFVAINTTVNDLRQFGTDGVSRMIDAILSYAQDGAAGLGIDIGFQQIGFLPGESVSASRLYTPVNSVPGHIVNSIQLGLSSLTINMATVPINFDQIATFDSTRIFINVS